MESIIELRHLRTLIALAETGSIRKPRKGCSALSYQIRLLANHFDTPLFERKSMPLRFTLAGDRWISYRVFRLPRGFVAITSG